MGPSKIIKTIDLPNSGPQNHGKVFYPIINNNNNHGKLNGWGIWEGEGFDHSNDENERSKLKELFIDLEKRSISYQNFRDCMSISCISRYM